MLNRSVNKDTGQNGDNQNGDTSKTAARSNDNTSKMATRQNGDIPRRFGMSPFLLSPF